MIKINLFSEKFFEQFYQTMGLFIFGLIIIVFLLLIMYFFKFFKNPLRLLSFKSKRFLKFYHLIKKKYPSLKAEKRILFFERLKHRLNKQKRLVEAFIFDNSENAEVKKLSGKFTDLIDYFSRQSKLKNNADLTKFETEWLKKYQEILILNEEIIKNL